MHRLEKVGLHLDANKKGTSMELLFDAIVNYMPPPKGEIDAPLQMLVSTIDYNDYVGRIGIGKIERGSIEVNQHVVLCNSESELETAVITSLYEFNGLNRKSVNKAEVGRDCGSIRR